MSVITSFKEKKREKEIKYERKMLRELSLEKLQKQASESFRPFFQGKSTFPSAVEDGCIDMAIEAYLLGASYSRFGYYGEPIELVKKRSQHEEKYLTDALFDFLCFWTDLNDIHIGEPLYYTCEGYISSWWTEGFEKGKKRWRLKLR
ncbi:hypothetical protein GFC29_2930 [Anoxybacillus sp. B7M1]|jgi:hypothetical protein|uniref:DUF2521 family protein n=1 Tax=Anoxybacteroides rupiense TaxID=311460 RepID=A0ABD5IWJ2_9BACL|nr:MULTISPECIES: DUF2521 family protein [Anoxybacillus]ANB55718.1 hypothetical protein GFC28_2505 [Anoxybacillus sp. B2M1]ANB65549.1 hypothetical protein GFC29_2930 [Anoxybacillus sp. B7M1]KXG08774.1 hypothetical protein AT864_03054 [Anoxybacillus sp. P3H1B]MBB3908996.1 hypothetical protein [Anoxybacillus rupiensis]MBS2772507.1 DUF2521 family protein [Anoxybacillus rupiensis]